MTKKIIPIETVIQKPHNVQIYWVLHFKKPLHGIFKEYNFFTYCNSERLPIAIGDIGKCITEFLENGTEITKVETSIRKCDPQESIDWGNLFKNGD